MPFIPQLGNGGNPQGGGNPFAGDIGSMAGAGAGQGGGGGNHQGGGFWNMMGRHPQGVGGLPIVPGMTGAAAQPGVGQGVGQQQPRYLPGSGMQRSVQNQAMPMQQSMYRPQQPQSMQAPQQRAAQMYYGQQAQGGGGQAQSMQPHPQMMQNRFGGY